MSRIRTRTQSLGSNQLLGSTRPTSPTFSVTTNASDVRELTGRAERIITRADLRASADAYEHVSQLRLLGESCKLIRWIAFERQSVVPRRAVWSVPCERQVCRGDREMLQVGEVISANWLNLMVSYDLDSKAHRTPVERTSRCV